MIIKDKELTTVGHQVKMVEDDLFIRHTQHLPQSFLDSLKAERSQSMDQRERNYMKVASVPVAVHEQWLRDGFDMTKEPVKDVLKRLHAQNLDAFITTSKSL